MDTPESERSETATASATSADTPLSRVVRIVTMIEMGLAGAAAVMIFVLVLMQAGQRYLPIDGYTWTGELARYSLVWVTFVAAGVLVTRDGHIALQILDGLKSDLAVRVIHVFAHLVVAATGVGFALACWALIGESGNLTTPSLGIPMQWVYSLPLLGFVSTAVRATIAAVLVATRGVPAASHSEDLDIQVNGPKDQGATA